MEESLITHIRSENNHADLMTKVTSGCKRRRLVGKNALRMDQKNMFIIVIPTKILIMENNFA